MLVHGLDAKRRAAVDSTLWYVSGRVPAKPAPLLQWVSGVGQDACGLWTRLCQPSLAPRTVEHIRVALHKHVGVLLCAAQYSPWTRSLVEGNLEPQRPTRGGRAKASKKDLGIYTLPTVVAVAVVAETRQDCVSV